MKKNKFDDYILPFVVVFTLFFYPVVGIINFYNQSIDNVYSIYYRAAVVFLNFVLLAFYGRKKAIDTSTFWALNAFWVYYIIKLIVDIYMYGLIPYMKNGSNSGLYYIEFAVGLCFLPMLSFSKQGEKLKSEKLQEYSYFTISAINIAVFVALISIIGTNIRYYYTLRVALASSYDDANYINPIMIGEFGAYALILLIYKKGKNVFDIVVGFISLSLLLIAASRGPFISFIITLTLVFFSRQKQKSRQFSVVKIILFVAILLIIINQGFNSDFFLFSRLANYQAGEAREVIFSEAIKQALENWFLGSHYYIVSMDAYSHNLFLDIFMSTGLIGLSLMLFVFYKVIRQMFKSKFASFLSAFVLFKLLESQTSGYVFALIDFWPLLVLFMRQVSIENIQDSSEYELSVQP
ncbi:MAG: O-antigen ligase family protein [Solirubrobacterales bacterium]